MKRELRDVGASVRARLLEQARKEQSDFQLLLTHYVLERLLYRLSVSEYHDRFVLKGALLLSVWVGGAIGLHAISICLGTAIQPQRRSGGEAHLRAAWYPDPRRHSGRLNE